MREIILLLYLLTDQIAFSEATITTTWYDWGACIQIYGSLDQNCRGTQTRTGIKKDSEADTYTHISQSQGCYLTHDKIDGGYTTWSEWDDCSHKCNQRTNRRRTCHNPTPCNGGEDCSQFGRDTLTKDCGPVAGQWSEWGAWGSCVMPAGSGTYGTGTYQHSRKCDNPVDICGGDYCIGINQTKGNCRVVPPCLTYQMFSDKFLKIDNPLAIYTSAQVNIYLLTKNKCTTATIIHTYFELYKITNITDDSHTGVQVGVKQSGVKFKFDPREHEIGYYRLYARIGYPENMAHWMEESMFVKIEQPPPHAFIKGGAGRTIGPGIAYFDARSVSYSLTNGPGDPSGLVFSWRCLNFVTHDIYNLLQFNIDPILAFKDISNFKKKWYETNFVPYIENKVAFIDGSALDPVVKSVKNSNSRCMYGSEFYVKAKPDKYPPAKKEKGDKTEASSTSPATTFVTMTTTTDTTIHEPTTEETTTPVSLYDRIPLTRFFDIDFMYEMESKPKSELNDTQYVLPFPRNYTLVVNEMLEFLNDLYGEEFDDFLHDTDDFFESLSDSSLTLDSLYRLSNVTGLPVSANAAFFKDLLEWLQNANVSKEFAYV
ncbi:uncharacterized protein [Mytilus edulis]|uniref:uncharacterized protein n=1 Tax=Mytilus edulis TaxID=6550 RepID=UPI0039F0D2A6